MNVAAITSLACLLTDVSIQHQTMQRITAQRSAAQHSTAHQSIFGVHWTRAYPA